MAFIVANQVQGCSNFNGFADHDAFTADVRLHTERYEVVRRRSEPTLRATHLSRIPESDIWDFG